MGRSEEPYSSIGWSIPPLMINESTPQMMPSQSKLLKARRQAERGLRCHGFRRQEVKNRSVGHRVSAAFFPSRRGGDRGRRPAHRRFYRSNLALPRNCKAGRPHRYGRLWTLEASGIHPRGSDPRHIGERRPARALFALRNCRPFVTTVCSMVLRIMAARRAGRHSPTRSAFQLPRRAGLTQDTTSAMLVGVSSSSGSCFGHGVIS